MERVASARVKNTICLVTRVSQVVLCAVTLACSAYGISSVGRLDALGFALFASITGMGISLLMLLGPRHNPALAAGLPGIVDCILSGMWSIFFLATGGALAAHRSLACFSFSSYWYSPYYWYGGRRLLRSAGLSAAAGAGRSLLALPACGAWDAATAMSFLAFVVYAVSCVLAGLDIKDGKGLVKPRGFNADASTLTVAVKADKAALPITNPI